MSSIERAKKLVDPYADLLCEEIKLTAEIANKLGLRLETVYFGGGTPTTLSAEQLSKVIGTVNGNFNMSACREFTVEAGRPDTITAEKLKALKENNVDRISINPQTLNDDVLREIGRKHTVQQFFDAFALARKCGFTNINTDLIAGLPTDTYESFKNSVDGILALDAECITVHTLSMKRSSTLTEKGVTIDREGAETTRKMLEYNQNELLKRITFRIICTDRAEWQATLKMSVGLKKAMKVFTMFMLWTKPIQFSAAVRVLLPNSREIIPTISNAYLTLSIRMNILTDLRK